MLKRYWTESVGVVRLFHFKIFCPTVWRLSCCFCHSLAWLSFSCCMAAAVATLNSYTKTIIEMKHRTRLRLEEARAATIAPSYEEVVQGGGGEGIYSVSQLMQLGQQGVLGDPMWPKGVGPAVGPLACGTGGTMLGGGGVGCTETGMGGMPAMAGAGGNAMGGGGGTMGLKGGAAGRMVDSHGVVVVEGCGTQGCEDCEREMDEIDYTLQEHREDSIC